MKFPTTVKKYRITDYSQLSDNDLLKQLQYFIDKAEKIGDKKYDHKSIKLFFSLFLNFNSLTEEVFNLNTFFCGCNVTHFLWF